MLPWYQYLYTGDKAILIQSYCSMKKFFANVELMESDGVIAVDGEEAYAFGDWMPPGGNSDRKCPVAIVETATWYLMAKVLGQIAEVLGDQVDMCLYRERAEYIKGSFRKAFFTGDDSLLHGRSQTAVAAAIFHDLINDEEAEIFARALQEEIHVCKKHFDTGFQGSKYLIHSLVDNDLVDLGYELLTKTDYPSFGYMVKNGATTLWEDWEGELSQNHPSFGDISTFFYQGLAGIRVNPAYPGFKKFYLKPAAPKGLDWVECWHECPYGRIESRWHRENGKLRYECCIPENTEAEVHLFDGRVMLLGSGKYEFVC